MPLSCACHEEASADPLGDKRAARAFSVPLAARRPLHQPGALLLPQVTVGRREARRSLCAPRTVSGTVPLGALRGAMNSQDGCVEVIALTQTDYYSNNRQLQCRSSLGIWSAFDAGGRGGQREEKVCNCTDRFMPRND